MQYRGQYDTTSRDPDVVKDGYVSAESLLQADGWGGKCDFEYDHSVYWPALIKLCSERRAKEMQVWRELGSHIGESEWTIKSRAALEMCGFDGSRLEDGVCGIVSVSSSSIPITSSRSKLSRFLPTFRVR